MYATVRTYSGGPELADALVSHEAARGICLSSVICPGKSVPILRVSNLPLPVPRGVSRCDL